MAEDTEDRQPLKNLAMENQVVENRAMETPAGLRVAMPSIADLIFIALLGTLVFTPLAVRLLGDAGIGWHIRTGQQILRTRAIPRVDPFSSSVAGATAAGHNTAGERLDAQRLSKEWFAWEWLYDVVVGQLGKTLGLNGVVWVTAVVIATVFGWTFFLLTRRGTNVLVAVVLTLLAISGSMIHFLARPHVLTWLFTLAWFVILSASEDHSNRARRWLWALPLLMLVWVNVHGGFLLGFVLLAIFWLGAVWDWFGTGSNRIEESLERIAAGHRARDLLSVGLVSVLASLVNPYGWKLHAHVYSYLSNRFLMDHIDEFQSPNFHGIAQKCFLILLLITVAVVAMRGRELRMSRMLTLLFAVYAGLYASRNIPVSSILLVMIVGPLLSRSEMRAGEARHGFFERMATIEVNLRGHVWPVIAVVFTCAIAANGGRIGSRQLMDAHFDPKRMPVEAANYLEHHEVEGSVFSPDYWGGYLIYRLFPDVRVVVDDRHDFYGAEFLKPYLKTMHVERGWQDFLEERDVSVVLLPRDAALANVLAETAEWKSIYADDVAILFMRDEERKSRTR